MLYHLLSSFTVDSDPNKFVKYLLVDTGVVIPPEADTIVVVVGVAGLVSTRGDGEEGARGVNVGNVGGVDAAASSGEFRESEFVSVGAASPMLTNGLILFAA